MRNRKAKKQSDDILHDSTRLRLEQVWIGQDLVGGEETNQKFDQVHDLRVVHVSLEHPPKLADLEHVPEKDMR